MNQLLNWIVCFLRTVDGDVNMIYFLIIIYKCKIVFWAEHNELKTCLKLNELNNFG